MNFYTHLLLVKKSSVAPSTQQRTTSLLIFLRMNIRLFLCRCFLGKIRKQIFVVFVEQQKTIIIQTLHWTLRCLFI